MIKMLHENYPPPIPSDRDNNRERKETRDIMHSVQTPKGETVFTLRPYYRDLEYLGSGSYGVVVKGYNSSTGKFLAIKRICNMGRGVADAKNVLREIRLMRHMGVHPNIMGLEDLIANEARDELYIMMELMYSDLHRAIQSNCQLTDGHHRHIMFQVLRGIKFLHDNRIIHRDIKPGNILISKSCHVRITDFGQARERPIGIGPDADENVSDPMTSHVVTRWFRAPELMLSPDGLYTYAVDMWSTGCVLAELLRRKTLFPGKDYIDQLNRIFAVIGSPQPSEIEYVRNSAALEFLAKQANKRRANFKALFHNAPSDALDFLEGLLQFDSSKRFTSAEALDHPYLAERRAATMEEEEVPLAIGMEFEFESRDMKRLHLKQLILHEAESFRREMRKKRNTAESGARMRVIASEFERMENETQISQEGAVRGAFLATQHECGDAVGLRLPSFGG